MNSILAEILHVAIQMVLIYISYVVGRVSFQKQFDDRVVSGVFNRSPAYVMFCIGLLIAGFFQWVFR